MTGDCTHNYYKEKSLMDWDLCQFSAHRQESDQPFNGEIVLDCESKKQLDTQISPTVKGCWTWMAPDLPLYQSCQWRAGKTPVLIQISRTSFLLSSPNFFCLSFPLWLLSTDARISSNINADVTPFDLLAPGGYSLPAIVLNGRCYEGPVLALTNLKLK